MGNIVVEKKGDKIIITCDVPKGKLQQSKSGKTMLVASTGGFMPIPVEVKGLPCKLALNITIPAK